MLATIALVVAAMVSAVAADFAHFRSGDLWQFFLIGMLVPGSSQILFVHSVRLAGPSRAAILIGALARRARFEA